MPKYKKPYQIPEPGRKGNWIQTLTGDRCYVQYPRSSDFYGKINEIAEVLAKVPRFGGHTPGVFYSVAEHSVLVSRWAEEISPRGWKSLVARAGLLHDAAEAYLGDSPTPIKELLPDFKLLENKITEALYEVFRVSLSPVVAGLVKQSDLNLLGAESKAFMVNPEWSIIEGHEPAGVTPVGWEWREAKDMFLRRFAELF